MFDLKVMNSVLDQLEEERGIPRDRVIEAIETALSTAYKKEYGKKGQIIRAQFDPNTGTAEFFQVKIVVDSSRVRDEEEEPEDDEDQRPKFNPEHHIMLEDATKIKRDAELDEEIVFPLEEKGDYGRIAAQTAKQVIIQKIREAEKSSVLEEYGNREGEIVTGTVQRVERGNLYVDLPRAPAIIPREEQIPGERFRQGERVRAYLYSVEESNKGVFLKLSRSHPQFLAELFKIEAPEITSGTVEIKSIAREAGSRSKIAVVAEDEHIDPVGSLVGQRGVRVSTVMSELGGEKIDIIEWSEDPKKFIEEALSPAQIVNIDLDEESGSAAIEVTADQQSLAIGRSGQNVRLAAKLTGWKIDITSMEGEHVAEADTEGDVDISENADMDGAAAPAPQEAEQAGNGGDETAHNDQEGNASEEVAAESNARDASAEDETATNEEAEQSGADDESDTETDSVAAEHEEDTKATDAQADASEPDTDTKSTT